MKLIEPHTNNMFLAGGGSMGSLTRNFDWGSTPLGKPEYWSQSLKAILSVLLDSRFPMFLWWGKDLIQFYNDAYRPSFANNGKHPGALGQRAEECWPEIWAVIKPLIDQVFAGGESVWSENQLIPIYRNGKIEDVYWTFSYSPVIDDNGSIGGVLVVCNETTEQIVNLNALKESEYALRFAIEAAELGVWDYNPMTNKFTGSERLKNWFGLLPAKEIDLSIAISVILPADQERVTKAIQYALEYRSGGLYDIEYTIVHPHTQARRIVRAKGKAWFNNEHVAYRFNGTLQDVTTQAIAHKKIEETEERARLAIESANLGTYEINLQTDEMLTSERFNAIWGVDRSIPRTAFASLIHPDDRLIREEAHKEALFTGNLYYQARVIHEDQTVHWVRVNGKVLRDIHGKPNYLIGVIQDITNQKELEQHKDNFIGMVSHELKTPLTSMFGYSQMLTVKAALLEDQQIVTMAGKINEMIKRLNYIILDLVDVSRIEGNKLRLRMDEFSFNELVTQIVEELAIVYRTHTIITEMNENIAVCADRERTSQVMTNLIANAIKYSPAGSDVIVSASTQSNELVCTVTDSGIGISKEKQEKIFERFYQVAERSVSNKGLGLGLYISSEIIKGQGGRMWVYSEQNKGSTFYFSLPIKKTGSFVD